MCEDFKKRVVSHGLLAFGMFAAGASSAEGQTLNPLNGHVYFSSSANYTLSQARSWASSLGGYLVTVNDPAEKDWLVSTFGGGAKWIGLSDEQQEGVWKWDSGEAFQYSAWCGGEPNNLGNEDYVLMNWCIVGGWNDHAPYAAIGAICELNYSYTSEIVSKEVSLLALDSQQVVSNEVSILSIERQEVISREVSLLLQGNQEVLSREVSASVPVPDLAIRNPSGPAVAVAGTAISLSWEIDNIGLGVANAPWVNRIYRSTDALFDSGDTFLQLSACSATLTPQAPALQCSANVPLPNQVGNYYLLIVIDADANVFEIDETAGNNIAAVAIQITPQPIVDLNVAGLNAPALATDGQQATITWTETNTGTLQAQGTWGAKIEYSLSSAGSSPVFLLELPQPGPLAPGASKSRSAVINVPSGLNGDIWFIVTTDSQGAIPEQSEVNNVQVAAAPTFVNQPNKPDLQVASITPPAGKTYVDNSYTFAYRVENRDDNGSANGTWMDRVYLSLGDPNPDPSEQIGALTSTLQLGPCPSGNGCAGYTRTFAIPAQTQAGAYWVIVETDVWGVVEEINENNNRLAFPIIIETATYRASVTASIDEGLASTPSSPVTVTFTGQALDLITGNPVPNVPVTVRVRNKGTRRVYDRSDQNVPIVTNASGAFSFIFDPLDYEAGYFKIYAGHPAVLESESQPDDTFVLHGLQAIPASLTQNVFVGTSITGQLTLRNLGDNPLGVPPTPSIAASFSGAPSNLQVEFLSVPSSLAANQQGTVTYRLTASPPPLSGSSPVDLEFSVPVSGVLTKAAATRVNAHLPSLAPALVIVPDGVGFTVSAPVVVRRQPPLPSNPSAPLPPPNPPGIARFTIRNDGGAAATNCRVFIPCLPNNANQCPPVGENCVPDPIACPDGLLLSMVTSVDIGSIPPGESRAVELAFTPSRNHPVGQGLTPSIRVESVESAPLFTQIYYQVLPHDSEQGDLRVRLESEATYWDSNGQALNGSGDLLGGARVRLYDTYTGAVVGDVVTAEAGPNRGIADFAGVVQGFYRVVAEKPGHSNAEKIVQILTGQKIVSNVFLQTASVSYSWTVVSTNIVDEYIISIQATFNTFVPAPKVLVDTNLQEPGYQPLIDLDLAVNEVRQIDLKIKNEGFITAQDVWLFLNNPPGYEISSLVNNLGDLAANQEVTIPAIVRRVSPLTATDCNATVVSGVRYGFVCGVLQEYWSPIYLRYPIDICGGVPTGGSPGDGSGSGSGGGYFGGPTYNNTDFCQPPPQLSDDGPPCPTACCSSDASNGGGPGAGSPAAPQAIVGDPIHLFSGELRHSGTDLRIRGRGFDFVWTREYRSKRSPHTAQGYGWDFAYNRRVERAGVNLILRDGQGRADVHTSPSVNKWVRDEFLHEITRESDGRYVKTGGNRDREYYRALDGGPAEGKLDRIVDRNGNTMAFEYDTLGRLSRVIDTLGRPITLAYNNDGYIASITDFTGRKVTYKYYLSGDVGGSAGDLKSVTSPAVMGTPNGNDFPQGKTESYTYTTGFFDPRLNHNLTSVTDGRGQTFVTTSYHPTVDPLDRNFDRAIAQTWGYSGESYEIVYYPQPPLYGNGQSALQVVVNDRVGNVCEYDFDLASRLIRKREYTGRAIPNQPTTRTVNRPGAPLRAGDPPFYETRWGYNIDSLVSRIDHADGTISLYEYEIDFSPGAPRTTRGNLRRVRHLPGTHAPVGDQPQLVEEYEYDATVGGGCCNSKFLTRHVDARGNQTLHEYDSRGNRIKTTYPIATIVENWEYDAITGQLTAHIHPDNGSGHRRRDEYYYYESGPSKGYRFAEVIDVGGSAMMTTYQYDELGRLIRIVDPRGADTLYSYNQLDQVVRERSRPLAQNVRYVKDSFYDANDNLVRVDVENRDENGEVRTNSHLSTIYEYDILNEIIRVCKESGHANLVATDLTCATIPMAEFVTTEYEYDANRNRRLVRSPLAVNGEQPGNQVLTEYDERGMILRVTQGWGSSSSTIKEYDYDENLQLVKTREGLPATPHLTTHVYDAYGRRVETTDAMGNKTTWRYDANGNKVSQRVEGELGNDVAGGAGNTLLAETLWTHDPMNRQTREDRSFFRYATGAIGDGLSTTLTSYNGVGLVMSVTNDNGNSTATIYDTANRILTITDSKANTVSYAYDSNSNVVTMTEVERSDLSAPNQTFVTTFTYDALDRQTSVTNNLGHVSQTQYDSRNLQVLTIDPRGNKVRHFHDGLDRLVRTERVMTVSGSGGSTELPYPAWIVTSKRWDAASRLIGQTDDNLNETQYVYDPLGRKTAILYADGTRFETTYDSHGNAVQTLDANGSLVTMTYDALHRIKGKSVQRGPGVVGTTFEVYKHDGLSRMTWGEDDDSLITMSYDSLSNLIEEVQNGHVVGSSFDGVGNQVSLTYPNGRVVNTSYDQLERKKTISDASGLIVTYSFVGPSRPVRKDYGNNTRMVLEYDGGKRTSRTAHVRDPAGAAVVFDDRHYTWDASNNQLTHNDLVNNSLRTYSYDSVDRLVRSVRVDNGGAPQQIDYFLDGVGNRTQVVGGPDAGLYSCDPSLPEPADCQLNQYTTTSASLLVHDRNGSQILASSMSGSESMAWDYQGKLAEIAQQGTVVEQYTYDIKGRLLSTHTNAPTGFVSFFAWNKWQDVYSISAGIQDEVRIYGIHINEMLSRSGATGSYFRHEDFMGSARIATKSDSSWVERYDYDDYGCPVIYSAVGSQSPVSSIKEDRLYAGMTYGTVTLQYYVRNRHYLPKIARFSSRDPAGVWYDSGALGSSTAYAANNPTSKTDFMGLKSAFVLCPILNPLDGPENYNGSNDEMKCYEVFVECELKCFDDMQKETCKAITEPGSYPLIIPSSLTPSLWGWLKDLFDAGQKVEDIIKPAMGLKRCQELCIVEKMNQYFKSTKK